MRFGYTYKEGSILLFKEKEINYLFTSAQRIQETVIGEKTEIECNSTIPNSRLTWQHKPIGPNTYHDVFEDGKYSSQYSERYSVMPSTNALVINNVRIRDAGTYRCKDNIDNIDERKAQQTELITLGELEIFSTQFLCQAICT